MNLRTCVAPSGRFVFGIHKPAFAVRNLRETDPLADLGQTPDGRVVQNQANLPPADVEAPAADWIYEVPNPFPFRGATFIAKSWADERTRDPATAIALAPRPDVSLGEALRQASSSPSVDGRELSRCLDTLPEPLLLALAATSTDADDLVALARRSCRLQMAPDGSQPLGLMFEPDTDGNLQPAIIRHTLYEVLVNNPALPEAYKTAMVLRPGVQGSSEITAEWGQASSASHIYEYLRCNSYIPFGHYAANMAEDCVRYDAAALTANDMSGLRHLYYQRTFVRLAEMLDLPLEDRRRQIDADALENLRQQVIEALAVRSTASALPFDCTLWGWNYGFDYAPSGYRMHGSHQQVHQQYALVPATVEMAPDGADFSAEWRPYACGDLIRNFIREYRRQSGHGFFACYLAAIRGNRRMDDRQDAPQSLVVHEDEHVLLFVPKAQTSQWELQLMPLAPAGNILEADRPTREALDRAMLIAVKVLGAMGARMITSIEYAKRFADGDTDQHLLYAFLPKLPYSPGAFTEAQMRWINGHYPEDFAAACRSRIPEVLLQIGL